MGPIGGPEIIIIAVVLILLFGVGKLSGLGRDLGGSIKEFRRAIKDEDKTEPPAPQAPPVQQAQQAPQPQQPPQQYTPPPASPPTQQDGSGKQLF